MGRTKRLGLGVYADLRDFISLGQAEILLAVVVLVPGPVAPDAIREEGLPSVLPPRGVPAALVGLAEDGTADPGSNGRLVLEPPAHPSQIDVLQLARPLPAPICCELVNGGLLTPANLDI